ncbi:hypothetical protein [Pseudoduganella umbonata]|uniref:Uncharacterized protein n=1 Tax=Pseudoduganella umbonata TaxID=864828 RepID=A0A7W5HAP6_9BURK|nr:hypothetical protein [Pseudoduganella umbonata]MBB3221620.1 hypothetical protein [Pseudoduganella umbonata]
MNQSERPTKDQIRDWMRNRHITGGPVPDLEQIKRELWRSDVGGQQPYRPPRFNPV